MDDELAERRRRAGLPPAPIAFYGLFRGVDRPETRALLDASGRYVWETVMDDYAHPNCRCIAPPFPPDTRPWYRRALTWLHVRWIIWRFERARRKGRG